MASIIDRVVIVFDEDDERNPEGNHVLAILLDPKRDVPVLVKGQSP